MPVHVSSTCAHRQEVKIVLYSLWFQCDDTRDCIGAYLIGWNAIYLNVGQVVGFWTLTTKDDGSGVPRGGFGGFKHPQNSKGPPKSCQTQPDCENC